jgi:DNA-binding LytR/AlgR family response regulator
VKLGGKNIVFDSRNVMYFEGNVNYCIVHQHNRRFVYARGLAYIERIVLDEFVRIHRKYLVNRQYIATQTADGVILKNQTFLPFSRRQKPKNNA